MAARARRRCLKPLPARWPPAPPQVLQPGWAEALQAAWAASGGRLTRVGYSYVFAWLPDGTPDSSFVARKIHARHGYRWRYAAHEMVYWVGPEGGEVIVDLPHLQLHHLFDRDKSRSSVGAGAANERFRLWGGRGVQADRRSRRGQQGYLPGSCQ